MKALYRGEKSQGEIQAVSCASATLSRAGGVETRGPEQPAVVKGGGRIIRKWHDMRHLCHSRGQPVRVRQQYGRAGRTAGA